MSETPTGIAGTEHHPASATASTCHVCQREIESPYALKAVRGVGVAALCSPECVAALVEPTPTPDEWRLLAEYHAECERGAVDPEDAARHAARAAEIERWVRRVVP